MTGCDEDRDHLAIQVGPGRLAVEAEDRRGGRGSLVDVVHAEDSAFTVRDFYIAS